MHWCCDDLLTCALLNIPYDLLSKKASKPKRIRAARRFELPEEPPAQQSRDKPTLPQRLRPDDPSSGAKVTIMLTVRRSSNRAPAEPSCDHVRTSTLTRTMRRHRP